MLGSRTAQKVHLGILKLLDSITIHTSPMTAMRSCRSTRVLCGLSVPSVMRERNKAIMLKFPIYLDNHATTPMDRASSKREAVFHDIFGNAASRNHSFAGWREAVEKARNTRRSDRRDGQRDRHHFRRDRVTIWHQGRRRDVCPARNHVITAATEHKAILDTCNARKARLRVTYLPVRPDGLVTSTNSATPSRTRPPGLSHVWSKRIGTSTNERDWGDLQERGVLVHSDATQPSAKSRSVSTTISPDDFTATSCTAQVSEPSMSAAATPRQLTAQMMAGPRAWHESGRSMFQLVGFGAAAELASIAPRRCRHAAMRTAQDRLRTELDRPISTLGRHRLPTISTSLRLCRSESLLMGVNDIAVSSGSACTSATLEPSYVLKALRGTTWHTPRFASASPLQDE